MPAALDDVFSNVTILKNYLLLIIIKNYELVVDEIKRGNKKTSATVPIIPERKRRIVNKFDIAIIYNKF